MFSSTFYIWENEDFCDYKSVLTHTIILNFGLKSVIKTCFHNYINDKIINCKYIDYNYNTCFNYKVVNVPLVNIFTKANDTHFLIIFFVLF
jgi:hypothetical protein